MKRIGIITLFVYNNYGNRLQMYAVQKVYENLGFKSEIIRYKIPIVKDPLLIRCKVFIYKIIFLRTSLKKSILQDKRISNFKKHAQCYFKETSNYLNPLKITCDFHEKYSFLSVGSDQIWGWFSHAISELVFLQFAPREKRIAFSPSFGSSFIDEKYRKIFSDGLNGFNRISVREKTGAKIIEDFCGKEVTVLCDPTMCLSKRDWLEFATVHKRKPKKSFILTYFLGEPSSQVVDILKQVSQNHEIVHLNSLKVSRYYAINPSEWVDYINSAQLFLTDSFHGVVFSIILQTPFVVYGRIGGESMQTRITNILEKFNFEERFEFKGSLDDFFYVDFTKTQEIIEIEKCRVSAFLKDSLDL